MAVVALGDGRRRRGPCRRRSRGRRSRAGRGGLRSAASGRTSSPPECGSAGSPRCSSASAARRLRDKTPARSGGSPAVALVRARRRGGHRRVAQRRSRSRRWDALLSSGYGQAILVKVGARRGHRPCSPCWNRRRNVPAADDHAHPLRRVSAWELGLAGVAIGAAAVLGSVSPPVEARAARSVRRRAPRPRIRAGPARARSGRSRARTGSSCTSPGPHRRPLRRDPGQACASCRSDDPRSRPSTLALAPGTRTRHLGRRRDDTMTFPGRLARLGGRPAGRRIERRPARPRPRRPAAVPLDRRVPRPPEALLGAAVGQQLHPLHGRTDRCGSAAGARRVLRVLRRAATHAPGGRHRDPRGRRDAPAPVRRRNASSFIGARRAPVRPDAASR